jgi:hypothetical protein
MIETAIPGKQTIRLDEGLASDEEIGQNSLAELQGLTALKARALCRMSAFRAFDIAPFIFYITFPSDSRFLQGRGGGGNQCDSGFP